MQALLSILPIALIVLGCGNTESKPNLTNTAPEKDPMESAVEWSKLQNRNGDAYIPNTDKPYSGWAKQKYDNEQVKVLAEFTDGSVTRLRQWQENGIPKWDIGYTQGKVKVKDVPIENFYDSNFLRTGTLLRFDAILLGFILRYVYINFNLNQSIILSVFFLLIYIFLQDFILSNKNLLVVKIGFVFLLKILISIILIFFLKI